MEEIKNEAYYKGLDKRTNEYKEWKAKQPSEGLGDTIAKITKATKIDKLVKFIAGEDCGCDERQKKLNQMFQYRKQIKCLTEEQYDELSIFFEANPRVIKPSEIRNLNEMHFEVFGYREGTCEGCIRTMVSNLRNVYNTYNEEI